MPEASEPSSAHMLTAAIRRVLNQSSLATLATLITAARGTGAKLLVEEDGARTGTLGQLALDEAVTRRSTAFISSRVEAATQFVKEFAPELEAFSDARILFERIEPEPRLVVCGAGHVGASLARLARQVGYSTTLIDDRADFVARERFPDEGIELVAALNWTDAVRSAIGAGRNVAVAVVTRGHNEDEECMRAVVEAKPDYVGLIGSRRRTNIVLERLKETGADESLLKQVRAPIGLDIGAVSPEEVALAILAEIVAERRGGTGNSLSAWRREKQG
ncbi:MAG TPA: XdhC family protein [Pyrinomonadaceae bacterium]